MWVAVPTEQLRLQATEDGACATVALSLGLLDSPTGAGLPQADACA